ncbi:MAG: hypothetical protein VX574_01340 [Myxococcota bacterium]|nr:hypothetical protein [Myxococcota bacterium]
MAATYTTVSIPDAISKGTGFWTQHASLLLGLSLASTLPASIAPTLLLDLPEEISSFDQLWNALFPNAFLLGIALVLLSVISGGALARAVAGIVADRPLRFGEAYGDGLAQVFPLAWTAILAGILIGIGTLFLLVPGIYLALCFTFIYAVVMLEAVSGAAALGRSRELARGNLLGLLGFSLLVGALGIGIGLFLAFVVPESQELARSAATALANGLVGSWASTVYVSFYFEIRRSREPGFDPATFSAPDVS